MGKLEFDLVGHRIKMLDLFADPSVGPRVNDMLLLRAAEQATATATATASGGAHSQGDDTRGEDKGLSASRNTADPWTDQ